MYLERESSSIALYKFLGRIVHVYFNVELSEMDSRHFRGMQVIRITFFHIGVRRNNIKVAKDFAVK